MAATHSGKNTAQVTKDHQAKTANKAGSGGTAVATRKGPTPPANEVAERRGTTALVSAGAMEDEMSADAGKGLTNIDADSLAIPFLAILQSNSPQVDPDDGKYVPDAKAGMFFNTVTNEVFDGKEGISIIPCEFQRKWLRWSPREAGGGFKGELTAAEVVGMRESGELVEMENRLYVPDSNGNVNPKAQDKVSDTRVHYIIYINPETGVPNQAVLSLGSTQIKKSKSLLSNLSNRLVERGDGSKFNPPTFANFVRATTVPESNEKGKWSGVKFDLEQSLVTDVAVYKQAKAFHALIGAGKATVNFEAAGAAGASSDADDDTGNDRGNGGGGDGRPDPDRDRDGGGTRGAGTRPSGRAPARGGRF